MTANPAPIPSASAAPRTLSAAKVYDFYEALDASERGRAHRLGGSLLLYAPLDEDGRIAALAGNIAGVATLGIDADSAALKQAVRDGVCDFLVNNLDEALRILKNEVRKKQPVSVCLEQPFSIALEEIVDRGVQPEFLALRDHDSPPVKMLRARGAVDIADLHGDSKFIGVTWTALAAPAQWLPKIDAIAAGIVDPSDKQRQRWLRFAARYLGRLTGGTHFLRMTAAEASAFRSSLESKVADGSIGCEVHAVINGVELKLAPFK